MVSFKCRRMNFIIALINLVVEFLVAHKLF